MMSTTSLLLTSLLLLIPILISFKERLHIAKDLMIAAVRAVIQLMIIGYLLEFVFRLEEVWIVLILIVVIMINAALNTRRRASPVMNHVFLISFAGIATGAVLSLGGVLLTGAISFKPNEIIPIAGMVGSNGMIAINLSYQNLNRIFTKETDSIESKLSLGATPSLAAKDAIRESIKVAIVPTIDSVKTYGLVSIPGMMTGLIIAGVPPLQAIKFQLMVVFIHTTATIISALVATYLSYKQFFNQRHQLIQINQGE
ncbi:iron export ABC transporter permease subunit FetB [Staphylococcus felis]|uniref:Iron export ABC transporter permease subunit FetB n=1 Tax=Staphylococcus felis TaxID=46127 RepID=A0A2K3Z9X0_9STAP|nr:iron export ABC transporter permease subunit FetB [Staphylococcus felis]AVP36700.1 iron export ABC transporter permease subunit FetB [Staphylococcus felis]MDQ7193825.1 iron export ABC transporter permease subunit FetB [Staphylococcus felis]PNZ34657.1 iron export ABC transporter permease subunit FetB [Staphylococcus felis]QQB03342.1 iron export ABC transporter permease subunit FetB [Staphylococcus felis]REH76222.1 iron export ABC transporter permease subunit FetB [Staphylococcus felis]